MSALKTQVGGTHYKDCAIQPVEFIEANKLQFLEASVVKRMCRHDKPSGKGKQDIQKAIHELQLLLELRYPEVGVRQPVTQVQKGLPSHCLVCGKPEGHGGLQCPTTVIGGTDAGVWKNHCDGCGRTHPLHEPCNVKL